MDSKSHDFPILLKFSGFVQFYLKFALIFMHYSKNSGFRFEFWWIFKSPLLTGLYQTVNKKAGLTLTREQYPNGFYLVIVAKTDDYSCRKSFKLPTNNPWRTKRISFSVTRKITNEEYLQATFGALGLFFLFYVVVILISCVLCIKDTFGVVEDQAPIIR